MKYDSFINILESYVEERKKEALFLFEDENTINKINRMLDNKLNHTKRVVDLVVSLAIKLNMHINYDKIVAASGLLHDIGRFNQALFYQNFDDSGVFSKGKNHGDYGYQLLTTSFREIKLFDEVVDDNSKPVIAKSVELHQRGSLPNKYNYKLNNDLKNTDPNSILTGSYNFNELEQRIISALLHMVRDADRMDILWQRASGEIAAVTDNVYLRNTGSISQMAKKWGVLEKTILDNNDEERLNSKPHIILPREDIPVEKLFVNSKLIEKMKNLENIDLRSLQNEDDYTFITALWWSIYTFLKDMNFVGNLRQIKERGFLEKIYNQYPLEYRPLIDEIFKFAKETLIEEQIENNKDNLYVNRKR